jgi:hypothetical protein
MQKFSGRREAGAAPIGGVTGFATAGNSEPDTSGRVVICTSAYHPPTVRLPGRGDLDIYGGDQDQYLGSTICNGTRGATAADVDHTFLRLLMSARLVFRHPAGLRGRAPVWPRPGGSSMSAVPQREHKVSMDRQRRKFRMTCRQSVGRMGVKGAVITPW